jgi:outer membrane immunogenic protein
LVNVGIGTVRRRSPEMGVAMKLCAALVALAGFVASTAALAADLPTRKGPPAPAPMYVAPFSWTGFYVGGYAGGSFGSVNWTDNYYGGPFYGNGNSRTISGFTGGGLVGVNYQFQQFVLGIEGEVGYNGQGSGGLTQTGSFSSYPYSSISITEKLNDTFVARVRGRLGYAVEPQMLLYVAGGWTYMNTNSSLSGSYYYCSCGTTYYFNASDNKSLNGWNIGVGGEYAFTPNWIARLEYIYDGFSKINYGYNDPTNYFQDSRNVGINNNTIRAAIEYKF